MTTTGVCTAATTPSAEEQARAAQARERAETERAERAETERAETERAETERAERAETERAETERAETERAETERAETERAERARTQSATAHATGDARDRRVCMHASVFAKRRIRASADLRSTYRKARELQTAAQRALGSGRLFVEWLLLETVDELSKEHGENVTQNLVATHTGLSRKVVSHWMRILADLGFVDRGEHMDGRCWEILLTEMGKDALVNCNERLEAAGVTR